MSFTKELLEILQEDSTLSSEVMASMLGCTPEKVDNTIKELTESGVILKNCVLLNTEKQEDAPAEAFVELKVTPQRGFGYNDIAKRVYMFPEVKAVFLMSGRYDLSVRVEARSMKAISKFVFEKLAVLDGVSSTQTLFIMRKYKEHGEVLLDVESEDRLVVSP